MPRKHRTFVPGTTEHQHERVAISTGEFARLAAGVDGVAPPADLLVGASCWRCYACGELGLTKLNVGVFSS